MEHPLLVDFVTEILWLLKVEVACGEH